jgi:hypothetical protein
MWPRSDVGVYRTQLTCNDGRVSIRDSKSTEPRLGNYMEAIAT